MEKSQESWKKYWPWIIAAIGLIIIVILMIFALRGSGSGGGTGSNPPKASLGTPTMTKAVAGTNQPWRLWTKYAIAYVDTNGTGTHDGKTDFCPNLHGVLSNVVAVQSVINTNPSFAVTPVAGYDILVFRTQAKVVEDTVDSVTDPVGKFSDCTTLTPGTSTETLLFTIKFSDKINNAFTDTTNPYSGPPAIQNVKYTKMTGSDPTKTPFRVPTYYQVQLSQGVTTGTPGTSATPAVSTATPLEYGPIISFDGTLDSGQQTFVGGYTINVYYSSTATGPWTQFKTPIVFSQTDANTISFTDLQNLLYVSPPTLSTILPTITYVTNPAGAQPWGYNTGFLFALSDYSNPGISSVIGTPSQFIASTYQPMATSYPQLNIAQPTGIDLSLYFVVVFCSDNSADRTVPPVAPALGPSSVCDFVKGVNPTIYLAKNNKYPGVSATVVGTPAFATNYNQLPFMTPIYIQATLTDFFNKFTLGPAAWSPISSKSLTTPITVPLTLATGLTWANYFDSTKTISLTDLGLGYNFTSGTSAFNPLTNATLSLSTDSKTLTLTLTIANPYAGLAYAQDFKCNKWTNDGNTSADCTDTCSGPHDLTKQCCLDNKYVTIPANTMVNKNGSCSGTNKPVTTVDDFANICSTEKTYNNLFLVNSSNLKTKDPKSQTYTGFCVSDCPNNWTVGNHWSADPTDPAATKIKNVCSALDPGDLATGKVCSDLDEDVNCLGTGCANLDITPVGKTPEFCQTDFPPNDDSTAPWTINIQSCSQTYPIGIPYTYSIDDYQGAPLTNSYTICSSW